MTDVLPKSSILLKSKSYDTRLDDKQNEQRPVFESPAVDNDDDEYSYKKENRADVDDNQARIIVTAFVPVAADKLRPLPYQPPVASEKQNEQQEENDVAGVKRLSVLWPNGKSNLPIVLFSPKVVRKTFWECKKVGEQYRLAYKFMHGERKLVKALLDGHGFREVHPNSSEFNLIWSGSNLKTYSFRCLQENQKVNHFPRSCELTRKDRLYKNIQRMQKEKGQKAFHIVPTTFVMPYEIEDFYTTFYKEKGVWIVKPVSLSRGRGIFLINNPDQIPLEDNLVVSKYISNPLLIEGFKFDLRLYVAVTSFDPLVFYLYEEGLTRFATIKYDQNMRNIKNTCMHLTNYSVNKKSEKYVRCDDPDIEDYGNKWSMSAFLRFLNSQGRDTFSLMMNIEETIIKTLLAVESPLASASRMFMAHRENCFELFGFDILIDEAFKPWVLEVNLSPSLDCDALLDLRVKSPMVADLLTLTGVTCQNPAHYSNRSRQREQLFKNKNETKVKLRPHSAHVPMNSNDGESKSSQNSIYDGLSQLEQTVLKRVVDENQRANGWVRLFPTSDTWEFYSQYLETRSNSLNAMLHKKLYPRRWQHGGMPKKATQIRSKMLEGLYDMFKSNSYHSHETSGPSLLEAIERYKRYERKLVDTVKPTDETLNKISSVPARQQQARSASMGASHTRSSFNMFPNGNREQSSVAAAETSNTTVKDEEELSTTNNSSVSSKKGYRFNSNNKPSQPLHMNPYLQRQSSAHNRIKSSLVQRNGSGRHHQHHHNHRSKNQTRSKSAKTVKQIDYTGDDDDDDDDGNEDEEANSELDDSQPIVKDLPPKNVINGKNVVNITNKYDYKVIVKNLEDGYYISRIQVREAFSLYLYKIQLRLLNESQFKEDTNVQQMELVLRFIKKAAPNLSRDFKVAVPSKGLPLSEQKRVLAKHLHDFLYIYRKDTDQIKSEMSKVLESERANNSERLIGEDLFQNVLHRCSELQLEEIMSVYMKKSQDSSVFLGGPAKKVRKNSETKEDVKSGGGASSAGLNTRKAKSATTAKLNPIKKNNQLNSDVIIKQTEQKSNIDLPPGDDDIISIKSDYSSISDDEPNVKSNSKALNRKSATTKKDTTIKSRQGYETTITNIYSNGSKNNDSATRKYKLNVPPRLLNTAHKFNFVTVEGNTTPAKSEFMLPEPTSQSGTNRLRSANSTLSQNTRYRQPSSLDTYSTWGEDIVSEEDRNVLVNGIKNLTTKQQERVYSAARSAFVLGNTETETRQVSLLRKNSLTLLDHLEKQKEETSRLLEKSRAKQSEMIASMPPLKLK